MNITVKKETITVQFSGGTTGSVTIDEMKEWMPEWYRRAAIHLGLDDGIF